MNLILNLNPQSYNLLALSSITPSLLHNYNYNFNSQTPEFDSLLSAPTIALPFPHSSQPDIPSAITAAPRTVSHRIVRAAHPHPASAIRPRARWVVRAKNQ